MMNDQGPRFFNDDETEFNPGLVPAPDLCVSCVKNDAHDAKEEILCGLTRADGQDEEVFLCFSYQPISPNIDRTGRIYCVTCASRQELNTRRSPPRGMKKIASSEDEDAIEMADDFTLKHVENVLGDAGCEVGVHVILKRDRSEISFFEPDGRPVARLRKRGKTAWEACWWSHHDTWDQIGDFGGIICEDVDEAVAYVLEDPMGIFW